MGYNIELINDLVSDCHEGMSFMMDTKGIDKSPGTSIECVLKLPPIKYFIFRNIILEIISFTLLCLPVFAHEIMKYEYVFVNPEKYTGVELYSLITCFPENKT